MIRWRSSLLAWAALTVGCASLPAAAESSPGVTTVPPLTTLGCERMSPEDVEMAAVRRTATHLEVRVSDEEVDLAIASVIASNGLDEETFWPQVPMTRSEYREQVRELVLVRRLLIALGGSLQPSEEEVDRAYVDNFGHDPNESETTHRLLRERLAASMRETMEPDLVAAFLERLVGWWRSRETQIVNGTCVEVPTRIDPWQLLVSGNDGLTDDEVRTAIAFSHPSLIVGPLDQVASPATDRLLALYYERGYLEAQARDLTRIGTRWQLTTVEGPVYRLRQVRVVEERDGAEVRLVDAERWVDIQPGPFMRSRVLRAIDTMRHWLEDQGGGAVEITPNAELDADENAVDLTLVVRRLE